VKDNYLYSVQSRVRTRIRDRLPDDIELLRENEPEMFEILEKGVCEDDIAVSDSSDPVTDHDVADRITPSSDDEDVQDTPTPQPLTEEQREDIAENLTGSGDLLEARVDAIEQMYHELQRRGEATSDDLLAVIDPAAVRFTGGKKTTPEESSWSNLVKGKDTLSGLPGVEKPPVGNETWRYTR